MTLERQGASVMTYRDLTTLEDYAQVVELERVIWGPGYVEVVPVPILAVTVLRGGVLVGAFEGDASRASGDRMVGFVYSLAGIKHGKPTQWSHMLGVIDEFRDTGVGYRLKMLQRERAVAMGLDLIEWTYDPMQALNAHLNFKKLGVEVREYEENVYGESKSPLHAGNPTDRFVAEWWIRRERTAQDWTGAVPVNRIDRSGAWPLCRDVSLEERSRALLVEIPTGFTEMLAGAPGEALEWRMATRELFTAYFARGYTAVDFALDRAAGKGAYLLVS
jgi:predicted GNAT superfamily acetyltransferase